jgi:hypothetical protein
MAIQNIERLTPRLLRRLSPRVLRRLGLVCTLLGALTLLGSCLGVTEMNISLGEQKFTYDLMNSFAIPIPQQTCPKPPDMRTCQSIFYAMTGIIDNRIKASCDTMTDRCVVDLSLTIVYIINVAEDPAFKTGFAQSNVDAVRDVTMQYNITNNANFNIDKIDVYIGPNGIMSRDAPGIQTIGAIGPIPASGLLTHNQQPLVIVDGTPAHAQVLENINNPSIPFNFLMQGTVRFKGGDPLPVGSILVTIQPVVKLLQR